MQGISIIEDTGSHPLKCTKTNLSSFSGRKPLKNS